MIKTIIERFDAKREALLERFRKHPPAVYGDIVKAVVEAVTTDEACDYWGEDWEVCNLDPERIIEIDHGDDSDGTLLFIIGAKGYLPTTYWSVYGSCSACYTFESIRCSSDGDEVTEEQAKDYLTLALQLAQQLKVV